MPRLRPYSSIRVYAGLAMIILAALVAWHITPSGAEIVQLDAGSPGSRTAEAGAPGAGGGWPDGPARRPAPRVSTHPGAAAGPTAAAGGAGAMPAVPATTMPRSGPGRYVYAPGNGPMLGTGGALHRFRVAVEQGVPVKVAEFDTIVGATLGDRRSWIGDGHVRLQRVSGARPNYEFTIRLVTQDTAARLCAKAGLDIRVNGRPYTSCRAGSQVVINLSRYLKGIPGYGKPLSVYRQYVINHEVGHALGHGHELCPGRGRLAPVMQQQTLGLTGCRANAWPFVAGRRYSGQAGQL